MIAFFAGLGDRLLDAALWLSQPLVLLLIVAWIAAVSMVVIVSYSRYWR